jgi:hypothetical protein
MHGLAFDPPNRGYVCVRRAVCVLAAVGSVVAMSVAIPLAQTEAVVRVVSNPRADRVSGGDVLIQVDVPAGVAASDVRVTLNGADVTSAFRADGGGATLTGLLKGLATGANAVAATALQAAHRWHAWPGARRQLLHRHACGLSLPIVDW